MKAQWNISDRARKVHARSLVWDAHACLPLVPGTSMAALERHRAAGVTFVSVNVGMDMNPVAQVMRVIAGFRAWLDAHGDGFLLAGSVADVERAKREGKLAVAFDLEGSVMLADDPAMVRLYRDLGVRQIHLAYNRDNSVGGGCHGSDIPLTALGREVVEAINEAGLIMDCSHTGYRSSMEIMERSTRPVVFSHSNPRALADHPRNIPDDLIVACAARGGVVGINGIGLFLGDNDASPARMARAAAYVADLVGPRHVGIGLDFLHDRRELDETLAAHPEQFPPELGYGQGMAFMAPERLPEMARELRVLGMSEDEVACVMGGNWLRIARQVWKR
jgi:membrane dipeptidase